MLGMGIGEIVLFLGIALVVMGPEKFPDFTKVVIRTFRDLRKYVDEVQHEVGKEIKPLKKELNKLSQIDPESYLDKLTEADQPDTSAEPDTVETKSAGDETVSYGAAAPQPGEEDDSMDFEEEDGGSTSETPSVENGTQSNATDNPSEGDDPYPYGNDPYGDSYGNEDEYQD
jgi:Tat protein translocase TatB subunit